MARLNIAPRFAEQRAIDVSNDLSTISPPTVNKINSLSDEWIVSHTHITKAKTTPLVYLSLPQLYSFF